MLLGQDAADEVTMLLLPIKRASGGGTTKDDNPRNQSLDLLLNYTWSFKEYVGGYLSRRF